ncbi:SsgA family sporulation/cell division regulator [Peterkaempfera sp. SMS 1(5)a]|uniref:SsgA family sporulation/cell division regulator n=1 Tax=Peterkaempfera podocarpi TaxID=3232308 RepID=UPI00366E4EF6
MQDPMETDLAVLLLTPGGGPARARLRLPAEHPHRIRLALHGRYATAWTGRHWTLPRGLLAEGLFRPCRQGGVRIRPIVLDGRRGIRLTLAEGPGEPMLETAAAPLGAWLEQTLRHAPARPPRRPPAPDWEELLHPAPLPWLRTPPPTP